MTERFNKPNPAFGWVLQVDKEMSLTNPKKKQSIYVYTCTWWTKIIMDAQKIIPFFSCFKPGIFFESMPSNNKERLCFGRSASHQG